MIPINCELWKADPNFSFRETDDSNDKLTDDEERDTGAQHETMG